MSVTAVSRKYQISWSAMIVGDPKPVREVLMERAWFARKAQQ